jgi:hypothetical protein
MSKPERLSGARLDCIVLEQAKGGPWSAQSAKERIDELLGHAHAVLAELAAKDAEIARLREALVPFRNSAKHAGGYSPAFICEGDWVRTVEAWGEGRW